MGRGNAAGSSIKSAKRSIPSAHHTHQPVIAPAAQNRALGTEVMGYELEGGMTIIIEPAHEPRIEAIGDPERIEPGTHLGKEVARFRRQEFREGRRSGIDAFVALILRIENAQRILFEPAQTVFGQGGTVAGVVVDQRRAIGMAARRVAERIELELGALQDAERAEDLGPQGDDLDIAQGLSHADELDIDLMELPEATLLRALVAEHRSAGEELQRQILGEAIRENRAHDPGGVFRPQRDLFATAIGEGVHLLGDDIGGLADRPREDFGEFEDRGRDLLIAIALGDAPRGVDDRAMAPLRFG
jgi:hypothetical protein